jgi:hypothetical protein
MPIRPSIAVALLLAAVVPAVRAADFPLAGSKISLKDGSSPAKRRVTFQARYAGDLGTMNPNDGATLRINGGPGEGDSGLIRLGPNWRALPKGKGFRYLDTTQSAGGIQSILLRKGKGASGRIKIAGGDAHWGYQIASPQTAVTVTLTIGDAKLCAEFASPKTRKQRVTGESRNALDACPCDKFDSTWEAIQTVVFDRHGCTDQTCHGSATGAASSGGLNLSRDVAYENLVNVFSELGQMDRVEPGSPTNDSFLYRKLAAKTKGLAGVPGTPMPQGLPALSTDELEAVRLWIQYSAQKEGVVAGTEGLLNSCLPSPKPPHLDPPAPPPASEGVQYYAPPWNIPPHHEDEGCYATYSDLTNQIPDAAKTPCPDFWGGPTKTCYFFNKTELTQEPNSHHSIIHIYRGKFAGTVGFFCQGTTDTDKLPLACDPANPGVAAPAGDDCGAGSQCVSGFDFHCGGTKDGAICDPKIPDVCGAGVSCVGVFRTSLACLTFGPPDFTDLQSAINGTGGSNSPQVGGSQQPFARTAYPEGVFGIFPAEGVWVWNSHAFNLTDEATYNQQWYNVYFAPAEDRSFPIRGIFDADDIFIENVPPFEEREYCRTMTFGVGTRLFDLSSHTHSRGRLFRTWGSYRDGDGNQVTVAIAPRCRSTSANPGACVAETTPPIAVTTQYNDPTQLRFDPPLALDDPDPAKRTFKFCSIYDNGHTDPSVVKRNSQSPIPPTFGVLAPGGPCLTIGFVKRNLGIECLNEAKRGQACGTGDATAGYQADDRTCDSAPGANDGICDACPLKGGVTTADEMFIPLGNYYCDPSVPGDTCSGGICDAGAKWGEGCTTNADCGAGAHCLGYVN